MAQGKHGSDGNRRVQKHYTLQSYKDFDTVININEENKTEKRT